MSVSQGSQVYYKEGGIFIIFHAACSQLRWGLNFDPEIHNVKVNLEQEKINYGGGTLKIKVRDLHLWTRK